MSETFKRVVAVVMALVFSCALIFADDSETDSQDVEPYSKKEFPQWAHDLRRGEIIAFGSLPFVLLQSTIVYSFYRYYDNDYSSSYIPNPLSNTSKGAGLDEDEQKMLLASSAAISVGIALIDFTVQLIRRYSKKRRARRLEREKEKNVVIEPIEERSEEDFDDMPPPHFPPDFIKNESETE